MCATLQERGESILLRSYKTPPDAIPISENGKNLYKELEEFGSIEAVSISVAVRATSAAPTYFPDVKLDVKTGDKIVFWDGGVLNNNPIDQIWRARLDLVKDNDPAPKVSCVLSLGTSWSKNGPPSKLDSHWVPGWLKKSILYWFPWVTPAEKSIPFLTNTEAKHLDFARYIKRISHRNADPDAQTKYFRFNTPTDNYYINMAEYGKMDELTKITEKWLKDDKDTAKAKLETVAQLLAKKQPKRV
jgi:hypothetical protein